MKNEAIDALENTREETLAENWTLRNGEHIYFTMPKAVVLRSMVFNQPGLYGPSADEK